MPTEIQPLDQNFKIVNPDGTPTEFFIRWAQQRQTDIQDAVPATRRVNTGTGLAGGGDLSADLTLSLDADINDLNDVDTVTTPPTDGQALIWDAGDSEWVPGDVPSSGARTLVELPTCPALATFTKVNDGGDGGNISFSENSGLAITVKDTVPGAGPLVGGIAKAVPGSTPYRVCAFIQTNSFMPDYHGFAWGFRKNDGNLHLASAVGSAAWEISQWTDANTRSAVANFSPTGQVKKIGIGIWVAVRDDGTNVWWEVSEDGANFQGWKIAKAGGFLGATGYNQFFFGFFNQGSLGADRPVSVTILTVDEDGLNRLPGGGTAASTPVPITRQIISGAGLTGGGDLSVDRTLAVGAGTGITVNADDVALDTANTRNTDHAGVTMTAGAGLTGGGTIESNRTFDVGAGTGITVNANDVALDTGNSRNVDHSAVSVIAGAGLTGGGTIASDRTLDVGAGTGITVNANDVALDTANARNVDHSAVSVIAGSGLTGGGTIEADRTVNVGAGTGITVNANDIALADTAVTPAVYGSATAVSQITVDQQGRLTLAADVNISAAGIGALVAANNLSDLANAATARTNLGLVAGGAGDIWVEKAGDTMTGSLIVNASLLHMSATQGQLAVGSIGHGPEAALAIRATNRQITSWITGDAALFSTYGFSTVSDISGAATAATRIMNSFGGATLSTPSVPIVVTDGIGLLVNGPPTAGTNVTITNSYGFVVNSGMSKFRGFVGIGDNTVPTTMLDVKGNHTTVVGSNIAGLMVQIRAATITDNTSGAGTLANRNYVSIGQGTFASANALTLTNSASLYIAGAPIAGTNTTITNGWSLFVDAGNVRFDGELHVGTAVRPQANDGSALGISGTAFSDLFLASGGVINWNAGNATLTHAAGLLTSNVQVNAPVLGRGAPVTKTGNFTVAATESWLINDKAGSDCTVTLPAAASFAGREIMLKTIQAFAIVSASSNVVPLAGGAAGTAIVPNTAGRWATLVSDGTNWIIMQAG